jgi:hypothetical protein
MRAKQFNLTDLCRPIARLEKCQEILVRQML